MTTFLKPRSIVPLLALGSLALVGCSQTGGAKNYSAHGDVYYLDGAGGGGLLSNWGRGVKEGLKMANFNGKFIEFPWETGMGVVVDQVASDNYKRGKAAEVARMITNARTAYPDAPITLAGLSAGTAVAIFTLEALPPGVQVDNVVLLGASIGADYNLTKALHHVSGRLYVFTSDNDAILNYAVPALGTADRQSGEVPAAGLNGFYLPPGATQETRRLYSKVTNIGWRASFEKDGDWGGHTDTTYPKFVRDYIAPLILQEGPQNMHPNWRAPR